jgi:large subunit ribosomal protein L21
MDKTTPALAVIKTGGKQYLVAEGGKVKVEKLSLEVGKKVVFDEVLLTSVGDKISIGTPILAKTKVEGKVVSQARHPKVWGVKMKAKKRQRHLFGHKQPYTEVEISKITS